MSSSILIWLVFAMVVWFPRGTGAAVPTATVVNYRGWSNSIALSNGKVEVVIVPAVGRIMHFGLCGEENVFWENEALYGRPPAWDGRLWMNFGGDKCWPAPEGEWSLFTKCPAWCPPPAFDGYSAEAKVDTETGDVRLITPLDPFYNIRVLRRIHLDPDRPVMTVTTTFVRLSGTPVPMGIWVITQVKDAEGVFAPVPEKSVFPQSYHVISEAAPPSLSLSRSLLSLRRDPKAPHKIGLDAGTLIWVGARQALRVDAPRVSVGSYPDRGSSTEIYTNPDPLPYIELETLGPLQPLGPGDRLEHANVYTLRRRTESSAEAEARKFLAP